MRLAFGRSAPTTNLLLSTFAPQDYERLLTDLRTVRFSAGETIGDSPGQAAAYFPTTCVASLICTMQDGTTTEVALIGNDGVLGTSIFLGGSTMASHAIVGVAGEAFRMEGKVLRALFTTGGTFQSLLLRYTQTLIAQISVVAACNSIHTLEKRLCRWLLLTRDCLASNELTVTQEFLASVLGIRRESVTVAAGRLQAAGVIRYSRGKIFITNGEGLENISCECYQLLRNSRTRMHPQLFQPRRSILPHFAAGRRATNGLSE